MSCVISSYTYLSVLHHIVHASSFFSISLMAHISRSFLSLSLPSDFFSVLFFKSFIFLSCHCLEDFLFFFYFLSSFFCSFLFYLIILISFHLILSYIILSYPILSFFPSPYLILSYISHSPFSPSLFFFTVYDTLFPDT